MSTKRERSIVSAKGTREQIFAVRIKKDAAAYVRGLAKRENRTIGGQLELILDEHRRRKGE